jgi:hypothetical protein
MFRSTNQHHQIKLATYCLPYVRLSKPFHRYIFILKKATAVLAEALDNS